MGSMHWSDEEAKYLKAIFSWQANGDVDRGSKSKLELAREVEEKSTKFSEFRVLVVGAKGSGKTSILTRFCINTFRSSTDPADPFLERGCRRLVDIDGASHRIDALEMPSKHLSADLMLEQALKITEGAVLVYDVSSPTSLALAVRVHDFIRDWLRGNGNGNGNGNKNGGGQQQHGHGRGYGLLLVGNKDDVEDEERQVPWAEGARTAKGFEIPCGFMEASAKTGDNVSSIFPTLGREILRLRTAAQQRRDESAERVAVAMMRLKAIQAGGSNGRRRRGIWKTITHPFSRRRDGQVQT